MFYTIINYNKNNEFSCLLQMCSFCFRNFMQVEAFTLCVFNFAVYYTSRFRQHPVFLHFISIFFRCVRVGCCSVFDAVLFHCVCFRFPMYRTRYFCYVDSHLVVSLLPCVILFVISCCLCALLLQ